MAEVNESKSWRNELANLVDDTGIGYAGVAQENTVVADGDEGKAVDSESLGDQVKEFFKAAAEMAVELGKGCRDIVKQSLGNEELYIVRKLGGHCGKIRRRLRFLNEYLPEDRDPVHAWSVILFVSLLTVAALNVNTKPPTSNPLMKKVHIHPPNASLILLPDGRYLAYLEQGVPADRARISMIAPHSFLSSRLAGIPGVEASLLEEFGVRLLTYDLPGFGESDPHPTRNLESSALDMSHLANAMGVKDKFWVIGHSGGSMHAWAALRYIPDRIAGAAMFAPMVNPYEPSMTKEERCGTWEKWTPRRKLMYFLARRLPRFLAYFYRRNFLSGKHGQIDKWLSLSLGRKDMGLIKEAKFEAFWQRDVEESIRQGISEPFVEEAMLQVSNWGFSLGDLKMQKQRKEKGIFHWFKSMYSQTEEEELIGFLGPIHLWQGMDDRVAPPAMTEFVHRILPEAIVHKLPYEGHFTYFYFCHECHREMFTSLFGNPRGSLYSTIEIDQTPLKEDMEGTEDFTVGDSENY